MPNLCDSLIRQVESSSSLALARGLLHAAEGKVLFDQGFLFASAVSTYYSLFHLGAALILAYCSHPSSPADPHAVIRGRLEEKWVKRQLRTLSNGEHYFPDPAGFIGHDDVPVFLEQEIPEIFASLGRRDRPGTLRDMREFVSYAPRMLNDGRINVLYSGCQYEPPEFKSYLGQHILRVDEFFGKSIEWLATKGYAELYQRILSGDFVLFEFHELCSYYSDPIVKRAWATYRSFCEERKADWTVYRPDPTSFHVDQGAQRTRYNEIVRFLGG
jgi:hypothetical protein